ncbi:MAG: threonine--tRNA ligase [Candidatus Magasanikbacteria bacterium RIFCSPHIGHO2_01_FULL_33_34]|uniref:Threonine--tRNA ligase n=1 Tax=Candidatus Magasanikbacteria bacterium RIFCSPHIGHO2_01_FULL_33_34 TaxID=1798671 RepID=A0A1F6LKA8_9BACT|nr:MAG: threonine--tRNA ligase [Candidatus Magasanikbacteria bacterium RIFCSPHIGHO2_01_FULL_33_34]OGH65639.1 MAG: threonine--tRNA ligase [Candidatus Magasanikbacteria bacterium RIFCSPHIGHO2_02_FULL_33_17]OGH75848.1 MAG: threonine--tRNA ligase [Candidatus Magasanikbacteria bacterium RIFCSPLOWO2_01_FULL_33_34]OGH81141.1 MAG: threonine--tRNA ligase [Candidatus Magasanikbacteria bacterium RIFCSPLOWO2_12_FULL_34_7]
MNEEQLHNIRHSAAHMLAAAVLELYPGTKLAIGPTIENGFYYDFKFPDGITISDADLVKIEKKMKHIIKGAHKFVGKPASYDEAKEIEKDEPFKLDLIKELEEKGENITFYESGPFRDLCRGGHVERTTEITVAGLKLDKVAGAYWRGDEKNPMLTRIYGLLFETREELDKHLQLLEEAKKRDHRKLGKELDLFTFSELVGPGLPLWTPRGTLLRNVLDNFVWELREERGYQKVSIPHITKKDLYETSGHWEKFSDELYKIVSREGHEFAMKPMNCPHHTQIYNHVARSYKDLPQRYAETTTCYRDEQTGELHGVSRTRAFSQDDAHVFCRRNQVKVEFLKIWDIIDIFYKAVGFNELDVRLSLHDPDNFKKYLGTPEIWQEAEDALREIAKEKGVDYVEQKGEAAFYGPKVDFMAKDSIGREWQVATIQLDINLPERFDLSCTNEQGEKERIVMIHAAIMGSIERFLSIFIEHHAGNFPVWTAPVQVQFLPVSEKHVEDAEKFEKEFKEAGIRVGLDKADETVGNKVRKAVGQKIPYILVVGDKEIAGEDWMVRVRGQVDQEKMSKEEFKEQVKNESKKRIA